MHRIYKTEWDEEISGIILKERAYQSVCSWSTKNLIAFTTGHVEAYSDRPFAAEILVHVICPENPNEVYHIETGLREPINHLLWDRMGTRLLIIDICGVCKVFEMYKNMLNCWKCVHFMDIGSKVVCASWLDKEPKYIYDAKSAFANLLEKFPRKICKPPLADIAGLSKDGIIAVTEMGVTQVMLFDKGEIKGKVAKSKLFLNRPRVLLGDINFKEDGKVHIILATDQRVVEFFVLSLRMLSSGVEISFETSPCIAPHDISNEEYPTYQITNVKFSNENNADRILVCTESVEATCLKYFEIKFKAATLQPVLQRMVQNQKQVTVKEWICSQSFSLSGSIQCLTLSGMLQTGSFSSDCVVFPSILFSTKDGNMHKLASGSFSKVNIASTVDEHDEQFNCLAFSPCDTCVFAITENGNIVISLTLIFEGISDATVVKLTSSLFQYCIAAGHSSWDVSVLTALQGDRLAEQCQLLVKKEITAQTLMVQERTFVVHSNVQADIYKGFNGAYFGAIECRDVVLMKAIYNYLHSTVVLNASEKEQQILLKIKNICSRQFDMELPKVMQLLEAKDVTFNASLILSTHHMIEWVSSYAVRICRIVLSSDHGANSKQIISILTVSGLKILRELLVLFCVWGQALPGWQPHFLESGNPLDLIAQIFKVISKLCLKFIQGDYSKDGIKNDEIPMRAHPVMYQQLPMFDPKSGVISQCQHLQGDSDLFSFDSVKSTMARALNFSHPAPLMDETDIYRIKPNQFFYDGINLFTTTLMKGESLKQCIQCSCVTLSITHPSRALLNTWREQWLESCFCGGLWRSLDVTKEMAGIRENIADYAEN